MQKIPILFLLLIFTLSYSGPAFAQSEMKSIKSSKIGVVDGEKLFDEYPGAQEATKKISNAQDELKQEIAESEKIYTEFEKQKKSEAEKLTKQKELQAKIDSKAQSTRKMIEALSAKIEDEILVTIKQIANDRGLDVVFDKKAVLFGGSDITGGVLEKLKKKSPLAEESFEGDQEIKANKDNKKTN